MPGGNHSRIPSFLVAGTHSGCGKTTLSLGLMAALKARSLAVQPFKCGPDFIDPTLHQLVTGRVSRNLDQWMMGAEAVRAAFALQGGSADISVIEGGMGMFDGGDSSSAALAALLQAPLILVVDVRSAAESVAAVVKGFETLDPQAAPRAVILNRIGSDRHLSLITAALEKHCRAEVLGYLPRSLDFSIPARHLGLHMGAEGPLSREKLTELARVVEAHIDLSRLLSLAGGNGQCRNRTAAAPAGAPAVRIGVARDKAFCFYYQDNLDMLRAAGAELVFFSPLHDRGLPENITGLYLGGGYPELYAAGLSANQAMCRAVHDWADNGGHIYAECGGFMYLTEGIAAGNGGVLPMAGVFPVTARMRDKRVSLGYREVRLQEDCILGPAGTVLRGHEYHYSLVDAMPDQVERMYLVNDDGREGYRINNVLGGYMHLHFGFTPATPAFFVQTCGR